MDKKSMADYIKSNYKNMMQAILIAQLDYLKSGKTYSFVDNGTKFKLTNNKGSFEIAKA